MAILKNDWHGRLHKEFDKPYYLKLRQFLKDEYGHKQVYPDMFDIFNALHLTSYEQTKVVIIGQDPYHGRNQAHGLSFSVQQGVAIPPSLRNIFQELQTDIGCPIPNHGNLMPWAKQGVLLLNAVLTVRANQPNSHQGKGWEIFTNEVIRHLNDREMPVVFMLWGKNAQEKHRLITNDRHYVIRSSHPSPFSAHRGFFGSRPFSKANAFLRQCGREEIDWCIKNCDGS